MRLIFAGTPPFAAAALAALHDAGHDIPLVLTQPDRPAGRGMKLTESAVGQTARSLGLMMAKPASLKDANIRSDLAGLTPDVMVVAAYGLLLPQAILDIPRFGCLNIHASLLPRWRGAAPVQRALLAGDTRTGIDIMQMEAGLDTGPVLLERELPITREDTSASLFQKLTVLGAEAIVDALRDLPRLKPRPQSAEGVSYAHKLSRSEAPVDWTQSAHDIDRQVRAFDPFPGAETTANGETLKLWKVALVVRTDDLSGAAPPGTLLEVGQEGVVVACGEAALRLETVQRAGGRRITAAEWARATNAAPGQRLGG